MQGLSKKLAALLKTFQECHLDILFLQEVKWDEIKFKSAKSTAVKAGISLELLPTCNDRAGLPVHGVAVMSKVHVDLSARIDKVLDSRCINIRVHRNQNRPLYLSGFYGNANDMEHTNDMLNTPARHYACKGEHFGIIGDMNCTPEQGTIARLSATGFWECSDLVKGEDAIYLPTRGEGRHIDYMVAHRGLIVLDRLQVKGPADHDLVAYDLDISHRQPIKHRPAFSAVTETESIDNAQWQQRWAQHETEFAEACQQRRIRDAWRLPIHMAEEMLCSKLCNTGMKKESGTGGPQSQKNGDERSHSCNTAPRRDEVHFPIELPLPNVKSLDIQSRTEAQLRRLSRKALEVWKKNPIPKIWNKIQNLVDALRGKFPEIEFLLWGTEQAYNVVIDCAERQADYDSQARIEQWNCQLEEDEHKLNGWIKACNEITFNESDEAPVHPQDRANYRKEQLEKLVCKDYTLPDISNLEHLLNWIPETGFACPRVEVTGIQLKRRILKSVGKAAGTDTWRAEHWLMLPDHFFDLIARVWNLALETGETPEIWLQVRSLGTPKPDGGTRFLSIAQLIWRAGMSVILDQLTPWVSQWASDELIGGLRGRDASTLHDQPQEALERAKNGGPALTALKRGLEKCFDRVPPLQAIAVLEKLGLDAGVVKVLRYFYNHYQRWVEYRGACCSDPLRPNCSILQGCPASCILLAGVMEVWIRAIKAAVPGVQTNIFIDDRAIWAVGRNAAKKLHDATSKADEIDPLFHWKCRHDKGAVATTGGLHGKYIRLLAQKVDKLSREYEILGIQYHMHGARRVLKLKGGFNEVDKRLRRIRMLKLTTSTKRRQVAQLVIPKLTWNGA